MNSVYDTKTDKECIYKRPRFDYKGTSNIRTYFVCRIMKISKPVYINLPLKMIHPEYNEADGVIIARLAENIRNTGIIMPVIVCKCAKDKFRIIDGSKRIRALDTLGIKSVPAIIVPVGAAGYSYLSGFNLLRNELLNSLYEPLLLLKNRCSLQKYIFEFENGNKQNSPDETANGYLNFKNIIDDNKKTCDSLFKPQGRRKNNSNEENRSHNNETGQNNKNDNLGQTIIDENMIYIPLTGKSEIKISDEVFDNIKPENVSKLNQIDSLKLISTIMSIQDPDFRDYCIDVVYRLYIDFAETAEKTTKQTEKRLSGKDLLIIKNVKVIYNTLENVLKKTSASGLHYTVEKSESDQEYRFTVKILKQMI